MESHAPNPSWMPNFRRAVRMLVPHRRPLIIGLVAALGVSVFYTFSISAVVPLLKVIFAQHETLADWVRRIETERRLDVVVPPDLPDSAEGLRIDYLRSESRNLAVLHGGDRIVALGGQPISAYAFMRAVAEHPDHNLEAVEVLREDGTRSVVDLRLRAYHWWSKVLVGLAALLPSGADAGSRLSTLGVVMTALVVMSLLGGLCRFINEGLVALAVQRTMHDLRSRLADHVLHLPLDWHNRQPPGDTLGRFATDISKVEVGVSTLFGKTIREPLKALGVISLTLAIDWRLLGVALLALPVGAVLMRVFGRQVKRAQKRASQSWGRLLDHLGEKLAGIRIVKAYGMQDAESSRFDREGRTLTRAQTQIELVDAATNPALETLAMMGVAAFVLYGGSRVFGGELEPHLFFAAVVCLGGIFDPVRKMGNVYNRLQQADVSADRLFGLLDLPREQAATPTGDSLPPVRERIEFRGVSFAYPSAPNRPVLEDVDLLVRTGSVVALVGPNGSGKTTLMSLLLRFYEPTQGSILIDGCDIATVSLESLRRQIGLVTQDSVVFSETLRENIAYGSGDVPTEAGRRAPRLAHVGDLVPGRLGA